MMQFLSASLILSSLALASGDSIVQTYFIPFPEEELFKTFQGINAAVKGPITTIISVAIAANNTVIYWDHWEDGYELDPSNPVQPTTEIWGAGSGPRPFLNGGDAVVLENVVPISGNRSSVIRYDGADRISTTLPIAVTRSAYPNTPGSLLAGAVEVFDVQTWGTEFLSPISQESAGTNPFEYAVFSVMAGFEETQVTYKGNTTELSAGETLLLGPLQRGQSLTSNRPIQVDLIGGDANSQYELRWYALVPSEDFTNEYYSPVAETLGNTGFWFYNPGTATIAVDYNGGNIVSPGSISIPPGGGKFLQAKTTAGADAIQVGKDSNTTLGSLTAYYTGLRFFSTSKFYVLAQIDADTTGNSQDGTIYDWGFPLIPSNKLTSQVLIGMGKGCTTPSCVDPNYASKAERSVIWVTPVADTKIFVDYDGDGVFDDVFDVGALDALRLVDTKNLDNDMTGAVIASFTKEGLNKKPTGTPVRIAVAWGQDPIRSGQKDSQGLDMGTVVLPLPNPFLSKSVVNVTNPDGSPDERLLVDEVGDTIYYEITVTNAGFSDLLATNVLVLDPLITDSGGELTGPTESFEDTPGILSRGETFTYRGSYTSQAADISKKIQNGVYDIENTAKMVVKSFPNRTVTVSTPVILATISGTVYEDINNDDNGDVVLPGVLIILFGKTNSILATTLTNSNGAYKFVNLTAGTYTVGQVNLDSSYKDVKDKDGGDANKITVSVVGGDDSIGNDFVDERRGSISGDVEDESGNPIPSVLLTLKTSNGTVVATTATDSNGKYVFSDLGPSNYTVEEQNSPFFALDVSDYDAEGDGDEFDSDTTVDNIIKVNLKPAEVDAGNNFVDTNAPSSAPSESPSRRPSAIPSSKPSAHPSGAPSRDPSSVPSRKPSVVRSEGPSVSPSNTPSKVASTVPSSSPSVAPSRDPSSSPSRTPSVVRSEVPSPSPSKEPSKVASTVPSASPSVGPSRDPSSSPSRTPSVVRSEVPSPSPSNEPSKVASTVPSARPSVGPSRDPSSSPSRTPSVVRSEVPSPSPSNEPSKVASTVPSSSPSVGPSRDPSSSPSRKPSVVRSEVPSPSPSNEPSKVASTVPSSSPSVAPSRDPSSSPSRKPSVVRSEVPSPSPSNEPSKVASAGPSSIPSVMPSRKQTPLDSLPVPSSSPSSFPDFCEVVTTANCTLCVPFRSTDFCKPSESLPTLIQNRTNAFRTADGAASLAGEGYWFHYLEDKIAGYMLSLTENAPAPEIFCCVTNVTELAACLTSAYNTSSEGGIVVKATNLHSSLGVYVLVPDPKDANPLDLITGTHMSITDIITQLSMLKVTKIIVEEFIGTTLPTEYKFHVVNGTVAAIDIIQGRGTNCPCYAVMDTNWNRLDRFGCFEPGGVEMIDGVTQCTEIDFTTGKVKKGPVKRDLYLCVDVPDLDTCLLQEMIDIALALGAKIGVYIRIDMFVVGNKVFVQEYSANHMNGLRHCAAKVDSNGCIDSCFLGRLWSEAGEPYGGPKTPVPGILSGFGALSGQEQCDLLLGKPAVTYKPKCSPP